MSDTEFVETGAITGTKDKNYNLTWFLQSCLENALRLQTYIADAEASGDTQLVELFTKAQANSQKGGRAGEAAARLPSRPGGVNHGCMSGVRQ